MGHCNDLRKWFVGFPRSWSPCVFQQRVVTGKGIKGCIKRTQHAMWDSVAKGVECPKLGNVIKRLRK